MVFQEKLQGLFSKPSKMLYLGFQFLGMSNSAREGVCLHLYTHIYKDKPSLYICLHSIENPPTHTHRLRLSPSHTCTYRYTEHRILWVTWHTTPCSKVICLEWFVCLKKFTVPQQELKIPGQLLFVKYCSPVFAWGRLPNRGEKTITLRKRVMSFSVFERKAPFCFDLLVLQMTLWRKLLQVTCLATLRPRTSPPEETVVTDSRAHPPPLEGTRCTAGALLPVFPEKRRAAAPQFCEGSSPPCAWCSDSNGTSLAEEVDYIP